MKCCLCGSEMTDGKCEFCGRTIEKKINAHEKHCYDKQTELSSNEITPKEKILNKLIEKTNNNENPMIKVLNYLGETIGPTVVEYLVNEEESVKENIENIEEIVKPVKFQYSPQYKKRNIHSVTFDKGKQAKTSSLVVKVVVILISLFMLSLVVETIKERDETKELLNTLPITQQEEIIWENYNYTVKYSALEPGTEYKLICKLWDAQKNELIDCEGNTIETEFVPEKDSGTFEINFTVPSHVIEEYEIEIARELYINEELIAASHNSQSVTD